MQEPGLDNMKQLTGFLIIIAAICFSGCSSGVDNKFYTDYGIQKDDIIRVEITGDDITGDDITATIDLGETKQVEVVGYEAGGDSTGNLSTTWSSSDQNIAVVDSTGKITAVSPGKADITVQVSNNETGENISDVIVVTVLPPINSDKKWSVSSVKLPQAIWDHASAIWNGYVYVAGGNSACTAVFDSCGFTDNVYYARKNEDGSISDFIRTAPLPRFLKGHSLLAHKGYLYVIGGIVQTYYPIATIPHPDPPYPNPDFDYDNYETILNGRVFYSKIGPDGRLGNWIETKPLPPSDKLPPELMTSDPDIAGIFGQSATAHTISNNGYIYVTGGWNSKLKSNLDTTLVGVINSSDGSISEWIHNDQSDLPYNLSKHTSVAATVNGSSYLYVIGGNSGDTGSQIIHNEIIYAKIDNDGILFPWEYSSGVLPVGVIDHATASQGRHIFVIGGRDGDGGAYKDEYGVYKEETKYNIFNKVLYYYISDTGNLQPMQRLADLPVPLFHHAAVADINNSTSSINIYVTGGAGGDTEDTNNRNDKVYYLPYIP
ncbi:MAG: hypothetical protein A2132_06415 [Nitrospirae bacterium RBG_16_43_11]|nr:MAG: hypothetical protein A2132_06415 [Nitrospirae bacterium RBG_16_43_11]